MQEKARMKLIAVLFLVVTAGSLSSACSTRSGLYCTSVQACEQGLPICDVEGVCAESDFITNTCISTPCWDAGLQDVDAASDPADAAPSYDAAIPSPVRGRLAPGSQHTCFLRDGNVRCWGLGNAIGYASSESWGDDENLSLLPNVQIGGVVAALDAGDFHTCALLDNDNVRCWGGNFLGQLGYGNVATVGDDEHPSTAGDVKLGARPSLAISVGTLHNCVLNDVAGVKCWGHGISGRLGTGTTNSIGDDETPENTLGASLGVQAIKVFAGGAHSCAIVSSGVKCWGSNGQGQLGYGNTVNIGDDELPSTVGVLPLPPVQSLALGNEHTCALMTDGSVKCWGNGNQGRLGYANVLRIGDDEPITSVGTVELGRPAVQITAGLAHTCALLDDATVRCWGHGEFGRLGYGNTNNIGDNETPASVGPVQVGGLVVEIEAGNEHTCALLSTEQVVCWGRGLDGRLGYGNIDDVGDDETPAQVGPLSL